MTKLFRLAALAAAVSAAFAVTAAASYAGTPTRTIISSGTSSFADAPYGTDAGNGTDEFSILDAIDGDGSDSQGAAIDRTVGSANVGYGVTTSGAARAKSNPEVQASWLGLNFFDQRFSNGGNQFSVEPPDQGLCAGNGYVVESTNDVLKVFDTAGTLLRGPVDLNTFYGYAAAINRTTGARGPSVTDPVCYYDAPTGRFVHVVLTLDHVGTSSSLSGTNHLDVAVSKTADPLGDWAIYKIPVQNNGTQGTPNHGCAGGFCLGDYPHIGADRNGIYLTTNEFALFGPGFYGAQVLAISKSELMAGGFGINVSSLNTLGSGPDGAGFTVWPATTPGEQYDGAQGGTEYFLSSRAVFSDSGTADSILVWRLTNTKSLDSAAPDLGLSPETVQTSTYGVPPKSDQKAGSLPLRDCLANAACRPRTGAGGAPSVAPEAKLDSSDSRFTGVAYANGKLWGALGTAVNVGSALKAGIAWYILKPSPAKTTLSKEGVLAVAGNNVTYPTVGVTTSGRGVLGFTLVGADYYPSAAYASIDDKVGVGDVHVAALGAGPQDGFTGYLAFSRRPRWGDYGAAAVDGDTIYIANEYIDQTCTFAAYLSSPFGQCGRTRGALGNWATRITKLTP